MFEKLENKKHSKLQSSFYKEQNLGLNNCNSSFEVCRLKFVVSFSAPILTTMKLAIIGAGPAGIFATKFLKDWNGEIHLFEANPHIGKKLSLTGGGRMNLTNKNLNREHFFSENERALKHIFKSNFARNYLDLFDELGIKMKWEKNRALLQSEDGAGQVLKWEQEFEHQKNLTLHLNCEIHDIKKVGQKFSVTDSKSTTHLFDTLLITSGGMFRLLERKSEQEIYSIASNFKHKIVAPTPCLSPIKIPNTPFKKLAGTAMEIKLQQGRNSITDSVLFTHVGISGPAVLDFSALWDKKDFEINFLPEINVDMFSTNFQELRNGRHKLLSFLQNLLPKRVAEFHAEQIKGTDKMIADINKEDFKILQKNLFHWSIQNGEMCGYEQSWTTRGGVSLDEINPATMESKIVPQLFFAGEVVDVSGLCGGYNITFAAISARIVCEEIWQKSS